MHLLESPSWGVKRQKRKSGKKEVRERKVFDFAAVCRLSGGQYILPDKP